METLSLLGQLVLVAMVLERILALLFDWRVVRDSLSKWSWLRYSKGPLAGCLGIAVTCRYDLDLLSSLAGGSKEPIGMVLTGLFLASGSAAVMEVFDGLIGLSRTARQLREESRTATAEAKKERLVADQARARLEGIVAGRELAAAERGHSGVDSGNAAGYTFEYWPWDTPHDAKLERISFPGPIEGGPSDDQITVVSFRSILPEYPDSNEFLRSGRDLKSFERIHAFACARMTIDVIQTAREVPTLVWTFNRERLEIRIHAEPHESNPHRSASYNRPEGRIDFHPVATTAGEVQTVSSLDLVAHETAHAVLDGACPVLLDNREFGHCHAIHEAFGDIVAMLVVLSRPKHAEFLAERGLDQLEVFAESFGEAINSDSPRGLRDASALAPISELDDERGHDLSRALSSAVFRAIELSIGDMRHDPAIIHRVGVHVAACVIPAFFDVANTNQRNSQLNHVAAEIVARANRTHPDLTSQFQSAFEATELL